MTRGDLALPSSWVEVELSELTAIHYGKALASSTRTAGGRFPVVGSSGVVGCHDEALVDGPCVVVGRKGAAGSVHLLRQSSWPIDTAYYIQPPNSIDLSYLSQVLSTRELGSLDKSTAIPSLSRDDLYRVLVPVAPVAEQARIVAKLEELLSDLDAGVAELKAAQKKLAQYRQSLLKAAVQGALTAEWRTQHTPTETGAQLLERILTERRARWEARQLAKFKAQGKAPPKDWQKKWPEPAELDTTNLPELPNCWVWSSLGQCFEVAVGATPSRKTPGYWDGGIPWVSSGEVRFDRVVATRETITPEGLENSSTQINPRGSVLLGMIGEGKTRGQVAILDIAAANNQNCAAIWVSETDLPSEFVYAWLWSRYEETRRGSSGNNQPALNKSLVERMPLPVPPVAEAQAIAVALESQLLAITEQTGLIERLLKQSTAQRQNILRAAFAGQLVPQDPYDEPASELLARIRAERATREAAQKPRGRQKQGAST